MQLVRFVALAAVVTACVLATPTKPFISDASKIDQWYFYSPSSSPNMPACGVGIGNGKPTSGFVSAQYNASRDDLGWDFLNIVMPTESTANKQSYYAAGCLEGYLTAKTIMLKGTPSASPSAMAWIKDHVSFMKTESAMNSKDPYWAQVGFLLQQMQGIADGVNAAGYDNVAFMDIFLMNFADEIGDVESAVGLQNGALDPLKYMSPPDSHCSALVKVTHDDLFVAHDTWDVLNNTAYRIFKVYQFGVASVTGEILTVSFSAHPAVIASGDDWYQTSNELAIQETSNQVLNASLYYNVVNNTVSEFMRVMVATYLATNGLDWTTYFSRHNSGTYNNQYMIIDFKLFAPGASLPDNLMWIAEQIPGFIFRKDVTDTLRKTSYWASYNLP